MTCEECGEHRYDCVCGRLPELDADEIAEGRLRARDYDAWASL